jgi:hypothetical protein
MSGQSGTVLQSTTASAREVCWAARDKYHACLDEKGDKSLCTDLFSEYSAVCPASWVRKFI